METINSQKIFRAGEIIMRQGEVGQNAYVIEEGQVEIIIEKTNGLVQRVGTRGPGSVIGEMSIVDDEPRTATVKALEDCKLIEITRQDFNRRLKSSDPVIQMVSQIILTRYRDMLSRAAIFKEPGTNPTPEDAEREFVEQTKAIETIKIANEFKTAMEKGELSLHYQPIVDLNTKNVQGFEALMRWKHPEKGFISPAVFIPVAEDTGLIVEASKWALRESCKALKRIEAGTGRTGKLSMSVNFSSTDFAEDTFVENLYMILSDTDVPAKQIHLEITERLLMSQPENAKDTLTLCRKAGLGISIDDFGTGYSSLSYLHTYPIDTLKIDQAFVRHMKDDKSAKELVKSIISLAKNMEMHTIAEGVEDADEAAALRDMGCMSAQGYFFSKPMAEVDIVQKVKFWNPLDY